jgi:hypothetical protein
VNQTPVARGVGIGAEARFTGRINKITLHVRREGMKRLRLFVVASLTWG